MEEDFDAVFVDQAKEPRLRNLIELYFDQRLRPRPGRFVYSGDRAPFPPAGDGAGAGMKKPAAFEVSGFL